MAPPNADSDFPRVQGQYCSWANFTVTIIGPDGEQFVTADISELSWSDTLEPGVVKGKGPGPRGTTLGDYTAEGTLKMWKAASKKFQKALAAKNKIIGGVTFDVVGAWIPLDEEDDEEHRIELLGCRLKGRSGSMSSTSSDPAGTEMPLYVHRLREDDECLIGNM